MRRVVVTGLGCISPIGNTVDDAWSNAINGKHGISYISKFDASNMKVKIAAEVKSFDASLYMERSDIRKTDLYAQYAIAAAVQAMEDSNINDFVDHERLGVYIGSGIGGISTFITETDKMLNKGPDRISPFFVPMIISNMASALVAIRFQALGVTLPVVTACATSTNAIGEAYRAIKHGYADAIITGGADACINPLAVGGFANCMALIATLDVDNASIPFDKRRRGFVMGEGSAVLVLEEYEHAVKRGAKIYAEISGYANTCDAYHMTAPHPEAFGSIKMIELLLKEYGSKIDQKTYINMHGTSTPMNDRVETYAVKKVLSDLAYEIPVSSTKSMTGHMLGAAGAMEAIFAIKAINSSIIPPTMGYIEKDEDCDLDYVPNEAREYDIDTAMSFSLGFGGHNAGIIFNRI